MKLTKNFSSSEFDCPCCGKNKINLELVQLLQRARDFFNRKITVTSGYRCPEYNRSPKIGSNDNSQHPKGTAADIVVEGIPASEVQEYFSNHFGGLGCYSTFTHVDTRGKKARW